MRNNALDLPTIDLSRTRLDVHRVPDTKQKGPQNLVVVLCLANYKPAVFISRDYSTNLNRKAMPRRALRCVVDLKLKAVSICVKLVLVLTKPAMKLLCETILEVWFLSLPFWVLWKPLNGTFPDNCLRI